MTSHPLKIDRRNSSLVHLYANGFTVTVFTNDCGIVAEIRSDRQRTGETALDYVQRDWSKPTA